MKRQVWIARIAIAFGATLLGSGTSHACRAPPPVQVPSADQQVAGARDVSVARVVRAIALDGRRMRYDFDVLKRIAGPDRQQFSILGSVPPPWSRPIVTEDRDDPRFWERGGGRLVNEPDCVLRPHFTLGEVYLVFLDQPPTWRSFEHIASTDRQYDPNDKWLRYVEAKLGAPSAVGAAPSTPDADRDKHAR